MDAELIIYLIFLAIIFISRLLKKSTDKSRPAPPGQGQQGPRRQPKSFEELLEEFTTQTEDKPDEAEEEYSPAEEYRRTDTFSEAQESRRTDTLSESEEYRRTDYEEKAQPAPVRDYGFGYTEDQGNKYKTLDELVDIEKVRTTTVLKTDDDEEEEVPASELHGLLSNPDEARNAIILSEIIRRRY